MPLDIVPLTAERVPDLADLFGQGGDPRWCWCAYFRVRGRDWTNSTAAQNREVLEAAVEANSGEGRSPGLVAYSEGYVVGWTSVGPRDDYERLAYSKVLAPVDDTAVWSIVCFVVGRHSRGQGVAAALLYAAIDYARDHGASVLEAYPVDVPEGRRMASANVYHGTLRMFERAGFVVVARRQYKATIPIRPIVRRQL
jgi:GNAT superfamily N-acetyltransferase